MNLEERYENLRKSVNQAIKKLCTRIEDISKEAKEFKDLRYEVSPEMIEKLSILYHHPDDIDLFTGLLTEEKTSGAMVGPSIACLLSLQFQHLRACDRFWFETSDPQLRFSLPQLAAIKSQTLSGILCRNKDYPTMLPRQAMKPMGGANTMKTCAEMGFINFNLWKDSVSPIFIP